MKRNVLRAAVSVLVAASAAFAAKSDLEQQPAESSGILDKYVLAAQEHEGALRGASMEVDISVDVPGLQEHGHLRALRKISKIGQVTYHVLGFQGDNSVKTQVIGRYLQAEQQGQGDQSLAITPANYKFKYKGQKTIDGQDAYVFQLSPHKKKVGLFKGEMWLDTKTYLPVYEKGRLVKNPSIFFKKVDFARLFSIQNGIAVPRTLSSIIDVRLIGKVKLNINYSNFEQTPDSTAAGTGDDAETTALHKSGPK